MTALDQLDELVYHLARLLNLLVVPFERELVPAQPNRALEPLTQRVEHAVGHPRQLGGDRVRDVENFLHAASVGGRLYASFSRTSWPTNDPSARPATCGMTSAITRPMSRRLVAPVSAIASSTIRSSSSSDSGSGMNSSRIASSVSSCSACCSRPPLRNASAA